LLGQRFTNTDISLHVYNKRPSSVDCTTRASHKFKIFANPTALAKHIGWHILLVSLHMLLLKGQVDEQLATPSASASNSKGRRLPFGTSRFQFKGASGLGTRFDERRASQIFTSTAVGDKRNAKVKTP
jgi:hypothetical protein